MKVHQSASVGVRKTDYISLLLLLILDPVSDSLQSHLHEKKQTSENCAFGLVTSKAFSPSDGPEFESQ